MTRENLSKLPDGWVFTKITEVGVINPKFSNEVISDDAYVSFIPMRAVEELTGRVDLSVTRQIKEVKKGYTSFIDDDLLFAKITPCMENGKIAIVKGLKNKIGFGSTEFHVIRIAKLLNNKYFFYYLIQDTLRDYARRNMQGTAGQLRVPLAFIQQLDIPLPPLVEQHRIVARLDQLLAGVNAARGRLAKVPGILKRFRQSVLAAACSGRLTAEWREMQTDLEPSSLLLERILKQRRLEWETNQIAEFRAKGINLKNQNWKARYKEPLSVISEDLPEIPETWSWATIEQLGASEANAITDGPFGSNLKTSHYTSSGPRVIRLQNIGEGVFINELAHVSVEHYETLAKHRVNAGDLVIAALGAKLPRACIIPSFVGPAIVKADCIRFKPDPGLAIAHYLNYALNEESARHRTASVVHGVARPRLNLSEIKAIAVPIPPLAEQHEIVRRVEDLFRLADIIEARVAAAAARAEKLTQAVLAKAFRGELVPTEAELTRREGRDYEPAATLLKRVQEERQATGALKLQKKSTKRQRVKDRAHG